MFVAHQRNKVCEIKEKVFETKENITWVPVAIYVWVQLFWSKDDVFLLYEYSESEMWWYMFDSVLYNDKMLAIHFLKLFKVS